MNVTDIFMSLIDLFLLCCEVVLVSFKAVVFFLHAFLQNWILPSPQDPNYFRGKKVLITGSAGGLGSALARLFVEREAFIILVDREMEANQKILREVIDRGGKCKSYVCDISKPTELNELITGIKRDVGYVDILVNNAGVTDGDLITDLSENVFLKTFQVNVLSHFWLIKAFLPEMIAKKSGHIVTIGSIVGQMPIAQTPAYCASKAAAGAFLESVSADLHRMGVKGITTTLVCPGHIDTNMFKNVFIRFPFLTPTVSAEYVARATLDAIVAKQTVVYLPRRYFLAVVLRHLLPTKVYWLLHSFLKTHHGMDTFEGKKLV